MSFAVRPRVPIDPMRELSTRARRVLSRLDVWTFEDFRSANLSRRMVWMLTGCGPGTHGQIEAWAAKHDVPLREELIPCVRCRGSGKVRGF